MHLLLIDDDDRIRSLLKKYLQKQGYQISDVANAAAAEHLLSSMHFDLLILDVMMPGEDGISFAKRLRNEIDTPILLLTARTRVEDRIEGLKAGADDYLMKPFDPRELELRIEAILRRTEIQNSIQFIARFGDFAFSTGEGRLTYLGENVDLTRTERDILALLVEDQAAPVSRERLSHVFGKSDESSRAIDIQIARLRKKLDLVGGGGSYIQTERGVGYKLVSDT